MSQSDAIDAPQITPFDHTGDQQWRREFDAFVRLLPSLMTTHRDKYVAVHHGTVVAVADGFKDAAMTAYNLVGYVPLHVGLVTLTAPAPIRIPLPRVASPAVSA